MYKYIFTLGDDCTVSIGMRIGGRSVGSRTQAGMRRGRCIALAGIPDALAKHVLPPWDETGTSGHHSAPRPADKVALERFLVAKPTKMDAVNGKPTVVDPTLMVTDGPTVPPTPSTGPPLWGGGREIKVTTEA